MGETGIGKTCLVRLLSNIIIDFEIKTFNVHAGITSEIFYDELKAIDLSLELNKKDC